MLKNSEKGFEITMNVSDDYKIFWGSQFSNSSQNFPSCDMTSLSFHFQDVGGCLNDLNKIRSVYVERRHCKPVTN